MGRFGGGNSAGPRGPGAPGGGVLTMKDPQVTMGASILSHGDLDDFWMILRDTPMDWKPANGKMAVEHWKKRGLGENMENCIRDPDDFH